MLSEELKLIIGALEIQGKMAFLEATTEEKIADFEKEKGVTLPSKYKEWLLFSDGGELFLLKLKICHRFEAKLILRSR